MCQFCTRTAVGSAVIGMIVRTVESRVDTMTVHICSGNDPNHGKGPGNYQAEKNDVSLSVVYIKSKMVLVVLSILKEIPCAFKLVIMHWPKIAIPHP